MPRFAAQGERGEAKPGGPTDKSPSGIGSSSMEAPTQGATQKGGAKKGTQEKPRKKDKAR